MTSRHSSRVQVVPTDLRNPGKDFLQQEIQQNRRAERRVVGKAVAALVLVGMLVIIREVVFL
jgi:hypothetical protein